MKKLVLSSLLALFLFSCAQAAMTNSLAGKKKNPYWFTRTGKDNFMRWVDEVEDAVESIATLTTDSIEFDAAASNITLPSDDAAQDLTIELTGATNSSVILASSGTAADALQITTTAGGIDITNGGAAGGEDIDIAGVLASVNITSAEAAADAIKLAAAGGGIDLTSAATFDIDITATGGTVQVAASEAAANQFKVDATGTVAGYAIVLETTDGGVQINADGASNGDIAIDAADDMTITAAGDLTFAVTGSVKMGGALLSNNRVTTAVDADGRVLTAAESGSTIVFTMTGDAATATLPEATADNIGMWFILVDGNPTAGRDLTIDPEGTGTINGDTAGHYIKCENDRDGEAVYIFSTAADTWYTVAFGSSTVWTEE